MRPLHLLFIVSVAASYAIYSPVSHVFAQEVQNVRAAELFFSPKSGTFQEGSTFNVPLFINTRGSNINALEIIIRFDPRKLSVVNPSGGKSIIGLWIQPPSYDNSKGIVSIIGGIPNGLTTSSGMIVNVTFKAKSSGATLISVDPSSKILLNDGEGRGIPFTSTKASYTIVQKPAEGVAILSDTHPFDDEWYNNRNPVYTWNKDAGVTGFSVAFDTLPNTIPDDIVTTNEPLFAAEKVSDGVWYTHVKGIKKNVWSNTSHFETHIDGTAPATFLPTVSYLTGIKSRRALVSFFTTDSLSGVDHYEVGIIDTSKETTESPAFFESQSPYQLPLDNIKKARVIVRAFDRAGNVREGSADITASFSPWEMAQNNSFLLIALLTGALGLILILILFHYIFGHHIFRHLRRAFQIAQKEDEEESRETPPPSSTTSAELPPKTP
jgi:hypothetical protein